MPKWEVSYTTNTEPTGLPDGAKVEKVSEYPIAVRRGAGRLDIFKVPVTEGALKADLVASLKVNGRAVHLSKAEAEAVMSALGKLVHERITYHREKTAEQERQARQVALQKAAEARRRVGPRLRSPYENQLAAYSWGLTPSDSERIHMQ